MANFPKVRKWKDIAGIMNTGARGWNPMKALPKALQEVYPELNAFDFGFFVDKDVPSCVGLGWQILKPEHFDSISEFNEQVGLRFGVVIRDGAVCWQDSVLMLREKDITKEVMAARHRDHEEFYSTAMAQRRVLQEQDPQFEKYAANADEAAPSDFESKWVEGKGVEERRADNEPPKKRGRPPKN